ncbi:MAG: porin family protein [Ignavibacteriaceae bacterium]
MIKLMVLKYLLPCNLLAVLLFTGCSNQYIEKEFNSKEVYYSTINRRIKDRNTEISFINGENVSSDDIHISQDSVYWKNRFTEKHRTSVPLALTKIINYNSYVSQNPVKFNGSIQFTNDSIIDVQNAEFLKDTISYYWIHEKMFSKPVQDVNSISFNDHWKGLLQYGFAGMFAGGLIGHKVGNDAAIRERDPILGMIAGSVLFGFGGMVVGVITGSSQNYVLNDNDSETSKFIRRFGILTGITSSTLYGEFSDRRSFTTTALEQYSFGLYYLYDINSVLKLRPELIYCIKGGNYDYGNSGSTNNYNYYGGTSTVYLDVIEIPVLIQIDPFPSRRQFLKIFAGPSINIPLKGELDEYYLGPQDNVYPNSIEKFNAKPYVSIVYGFGLKWDQHFSTELLFDSGLTGLGSAIMSDGTKLNLRQNNILVITTFSL